MEKVVSLEIIDSYFHKLKDNLSVDCAIVGGGPSGLVAADYLAKAGRKISLFERRLALGGGMWGGGMMVNQIFVQKEALPILDGFNISYVPYEKSHLQEFILQKKNWNESTEPEAPLFSGHGGQHSTTTVLCISLKQAVKEADLRNDLTIHSAQHGYTPLLYYKTKGLRAVQKKLGHSSLIIASLYADIMPEENREIVN
jgi:hypothetical protein